MSQIRVNRCIKYLKQNKTKQTQHNLLNDAVKINKIFKEDSSKYTDDTSVSEL